MRDPRLAEDARGFTGQEAMHAAPHQSVLDHLAARGVHTGAYVARMERMFREALGDRGRAGDVECVERVALVAAVVRVTRRARRRRPTPTARGGDAARTLPFEHALVIADAALRLPGHSAPGPRLLGAARRPGSRHRCCRGGCAPRGDPSADRLRPAERRLRRRRTSAAHPCLPGPRRPKGVCDGRKGCAAGGQAAVATLSCTKANGGLVTAVPSANTTVGTV